MLHPHQAVTQVHAHPRQLLAAINQDKQVLLDWYKKFHKPQMQVPTTPTPNQFQDAVNQWRMDQFQDVKLHIMERLATLPTLVDFHTALILRKSTKQIYIHQMVTEKHLHKTKIMISKIQPSRSKMLHHQSRHQSRDKDVQLNHAHPQELLVAWLHQKPKQLPSLKNQTLEFIHLTILHH